MTPAELLPIVTATSGVLSVIVAVWTMLSHFDKRNTDRIESLKEVLCAEMKEMRAELRLEIREAGDRRVSVK